tara:strand:+ start:2130 stop:2342 length:213 start_codon:yes stop_codon:yes gene_type:complete
MTLNEKQSSNLMKDVDTLIDKVTDLEQKLINLNAKFKTMAKVTSNLVEYTDMPEAPYMPCDPDDGSWVGR